MAETLGPAYTKICPWESDKSHMERCLTCNSVLLKEETICLECDTKVGNDDRGIGGFVATFVSILFYLSVAVLVVSPFVDRAPSFIFCVFISSALLFVMRTAKDGAQKIKKH